MCTLAVIFLGLWMNSVGKKYERVLRWTTDAKAPRLPLATVLAVVRDGPVTLRRECLVPDGPDLTAIES